MSAPRPRPSVERLEEDLRAVADSLVEVREIVDAHSATLDQHTATLDQHTATLDQHTATLAEHGALLREHTSLLHEILRRLDTR